MGFSKAIFTHLESVAHHESWCLAIYFQWNQRIEISHLRLKLRRFYKSHLGLMGWSNFRWYAVFRSYDSFLTRQMAIQFDNGFGNN